MEGKEVEGEDEEDVWRMGLGEIQGTRDRVMTRQRERYGMGDRLRDERLTSA